MRELMRIVAIFVMAGILTVPVHELGHAIAGTMLGVRIEEICWLGFKTVHNGGQTETLLGYVAFNHDDFQRVGLMGRAFILSAGGGFVLLLGVATRRWPKISCILIFSGLIQLPVEVFGLLGSMIIFLIVYEIYPNILSPLRE